MNEREVYSIDTSNILFIFCGAFTGLDKIIEARLGKRVQPRTDNFVTWANMFVLEYWIWSEYSIQLFYAFEPSTQ